MLGLTCDPVAGLVEIPCIKRNVSGAVNAIIASQMAMAGIKSAIPADEVFETMGRIGNLIPPCLKETSQDGLAQTSTAQKVFEKLSSASGISDN
jgi:L-serine dehydratase